MVVFRFDVLKSQYEQGPRLSYLGLRAEGAVVDIERDRVEKNSKIIRT